jgi:arylsulfatase A-like enzyme
MNRKKKPTGNIRIDNPSFPIKKIVLLGFLACFIFACIENFIFYFTSELYWQYYMFSTALWLFVSIIINFSLLGLYVMAKNLIPCSRLKRYHSNFFLVLVVFLFSPHFFYTIILTLKRMPGKFYTISNLGVILIILLLLTPLWYYSYNFLKDRKKSIISNSILIVLLTGFSSVFGVIVLGSEFQSEQWLFAILVIILFNTLIPFFLIYILRLSRKLKLTGRMITTGCLLMAEVFLGISLINPVLRNLAFGQRNSYNLNRERKRNKNLPNIILITMDTARAANMSLYGYKRPTTPNLEQFARDAVVFKNAISSAPWTLPSHASLFTGLPSCLHLATHGKTREKFVFPLGEEHETLSEILSSRGYKTGSVIANTSYLAPWTGLSQGFDYYWWGKASSQSLLPVIFLTGTYTPPENDTNLKWVYGISDVASAKRINRVSIDWILSNNKKKHPWFLFINYMETHGMAYLPSPYSEMFTSPPMLAFGPKDEKSLSKVRAWYDNQIAYLDYEIGRLLNKLKEQNAYNNTLIIVTSDHGELLGEHGDFGHEYWLYQELLHVPLIVKYPGGKRRGEVIRELVQNIDVFAEILGCVGLPLPPYIQGQPFDKVDHPVFSEVYLSPCLSEKKLLTYAQNLRSIFSRELDFFKLIRSNKGERELYNIAIDPGEKNKIDDPDRIKIVESELDHYLDSLTKYMKKRTHKSKKLSKETLDRLRSLGYIK